MKRMLLSVVSFVVIASQAGRAAADMDVTFETVDEVSRSSDSDYRLHVRGIPQGQTEPVELAAVIARSDEHTALLAQGASCERMALLAASRPGRYLLRLTTSTSTNELEFLDSCRLIRR